MAKLSKKDVEHVGLLAKLTLTPKEVSLFQKQLSQIVNYVEELSEVDTSKVEPTSQTTGLKNVFRNDEVGPSGIIFKSGYFEVGRLIKK